MSEKNTQLEQLDRAIHEVRVTMEIAKNTGRILREGSHPGSVAWQVADGINFLANLEKQAKEALQNLEDQKREAAKAAKEAEKAPEAGSAA